MVLSPLPYQDHKKQGASMERDPLAVLSGLRVDAARQITALL